MPVNQVQLPSRETTTYKTYEASGQSHRMFCGKCGSAITFQFLDAPHEVEIWVGTIDEKWLMGEQVEESERATERRTKSDYETGFLDQLSTIDTNIFMENAFKGITDTMPGEKFNTTREEGLAFPE